MRLWKEQPEKGPGGSGSRGCEEAGNYEGFFDKSLHQGAKGGIHTVSVAYLVKVVGKPEVKLNSDHSEFRWVTIIDEGWHPYVKQIIRDSGVFG